MKISRSEDHSEVYLEWAMEKCGWVRARALQHGPDPAPGLTVDFLIGLAVGDPKGLDWQHRYYKTARRIIHVEVPKELRSRGLDRRVCSVCGEECLEYQFEWGAGDHPDEPCRQCKRERS